MTTKRFVAVLLVCLLVVPLYPGKGPAYAGQNRYTGFEESMAYGLRELGLFQGIGSKADGSPDFDLNRAPTRAEALTMLVRILGKESEAAGSSWANPFTDVPAWAEPYVGYAYANGLTKGVSESLFGTGDTATSSMYLTFVLRALGYSDHEGADFTWDDPFSLASSVGVLPFGVDTDGFLRADVVMVSYAGLFAKMKGEAKTLAHHLMDEGVFSQTQFSDNTDQRMLLAHTIPPIRLTGNWPCSEEFLKEKWAEIYPLFSRYLGLPTKILTEGVTWGWDDNIVPDTVGYYAATNSFMVGPLPNHRNFDKSNHYDYEPLLLQCMHETAHLFWQVGDRNLDFDFGQWAWEAAALVAEELLRAEYYGDMSAGASIYDLIDYCGWEHVNGVRNDGNKYDRRIENSAAAKSFFFLATVLSADRGNTYFADVNDYRVKHYERTGEMSISLDDYCVALDKAARGRTIDGMIPSKWLRSQAVSNTDGKIGDYLLVAPARIPDDMPDRYEILVEGWNRTVDHRGDKVEKGLAGQKVDLTLYDAQGNKVSTSSAVLGHDGCSDAAFTFSRGEIPHGSVVRFTAEATVNGKVIRASNLGLYGPQMDFLGNKPRATSDALIVLLTDGQGHIAADLEKEDITVTGASSVDFSHLSGGFLSISTSQGSTVTITFANREAGTGPLTYNLSKPLGLRAVPVVAKQ